MTAPTAGSARPPQAPPTLKSLLDRFPVLAPPVGAAGAAVTLVLREGLGEVETLLIVRAQNPEDPASGQVALPGGHVTDGDGSLAATAIRELEEEVGLGLADLDGPPRFVTLQPAPRFGITVGVFAAALGPVETAPRARSPTEVAHVFWLPASALAETRVVTRPTHLGPREVPATVAHGEVLWGFTRRVLRDFFGLPREPELLGGTPVRPPVGIGPGPASAGTNDPPRPGRWADPP